MNNKVAKAVIIILNSIGIVCLIYFGYFLLIHDTAIPNPDAMLPTERWDTSGFCLCLGVIPMVIANTLGFVFVKPKNKVIRFLWFAPLLITVVLAAYYLIIAS